MGARLRRQLDALWRRLVVVCNGLGHFAIRRRAPLRSLGRSGSLRHPERASVSLPEAAGWTPPALSDRTALLGYAASAGSILVSFRPHHDRLCSRDSTGARLSSVGRRARILR